MVKLDLALVFQQGHSRPVPVDMDRQMIIYVVGERIEAIKRNPTLIDMVPYDNSDVFYKSRTHLNQHGWDTSVYNDNVAGGSARRKDFYDKIKDVCENYYGKKRHQIGIFPEDRAVMAFHGNYNSVGFENLRSLMLRGTDVIVVEKAGRVL